MIPEHEHRFSQSRFQPRISGVGLLAIALSIWGCIAIYNATADVSPPYLFIVKQIAWLPVGIAALIVVTSLRPDVLRTGGLIAGVGGYITLWLVLRYGVQVNGMRGWFNWNGIFFQPSEIGKPLFILMLAYVFDTCINRTFKWMKIFLFALILTACWLVPIALQPDFGAILLYVGVFIALCWCIGCPARYIGAAAGGSTLFACLVMYLNPYVWERFTAFVRPEHDPQTAGWHVTQFQKVISSGNLTGNSFTSGSETISSLPVAYSDSIFACTAGSFGYIGVVPLIVLIGAWIVYGFWHTLSATDTFKKTALAGCTLMVALQALVHLSVNLGLLPITGLTLPLISYGGSSLVSTMATVGIVEAIVAHERTQGQIEGIDHIGGGTSDEIS